MSIAHSQPASRLAVLIGAPHRGDVSMHNDLAAMYDALRQRGLAPEEVLCLEGTLERRLLLSFVGTISRRIAGWQTGQILLHVSGHGYYTCDSRNRIRIGLELQETSNTSGEGQVFWDEIFRALALPDAVQFMLLPDH
jgi:hypothetical protein